MVWDQKCRTRANHGLKINDFEIYAAQSDIDSKVIYLLFFLSTCILRTDIKITVFLRIYRYCVPMMTPSLFFLMSFSYLSASLVRFKYIKPPKAQKTRINYTYWYTNPTRMHESMAASCHLMFITCLLLSTITLANLLFQIFHCKSPHFSEKVGGGVGLACIYIYKYTSKPYRSIMYRMYICIYS